MELCKGKKKEGRRKVVASLFLEAHCDSRLNIFKSGINRAWDLRKKNRKKYWNRGDNKP